MPIFPGIEILPGEAGALVDQYYQYEYNGLVFGHDTPIMVTDSDGILSTPGINDRDVERMDGHGVWPVSAFAGGREVEFDLAVPADSGWDAHQQLQILERAFVLDPELYFKLVFWRPGYPQRYLWAQTRERDFDANYDLAHGLLVGSVQLFCANPRMYSLIQKTMAMTIPVGGGFAPGATVNNSGSTRAAPMMTVTGPFETITIGNQDDENRQFKFNTPLVAGQTLVIDVARRDVTVAGADVYGGIPADSQWWSLRPGDNRLTFNRTGAGAASFLTIDYRDTWL